MSESLLSMAHLQNEEAAYAFVEARIWPHGPVCPHCGGTERNKKMMGKATRIGLYKCYDCRSQFTVKVGTIFESSHDNSSTDNAPAAACKPAGALMVETHRSRKFYRVETVKTYQVQHPLNNPLSRDYHCAIAPLRALLRRPEEVRAKAQRRKGGTKA